MGVPINSTTLGIILDTEQMEIRLPRNKLTRIFDNMAPKEKSLTLTGTLQHTTKVVCPGRAFVARMHSMVHR